MKMDFAMRRVHLAHGKEWHDKVELGQMPHQTGPTHYYPTFAGI
jgi:hypothetical protein